MFFYRGVVLASILLAIYIQVSAVPQPGIIRERHIIHAPIKFKIIHHYKVQKVPIIVKKHLYYNKHHREHEALIEEQEFDHSDDHQDFSTVQHQDDHRNYRNYLNEIPYGHTQHGIHEDYEEHQQSQEAEYDDYEYE